MKRYNNTVQRRMVLHAVRELSGHPTTEEIYLHIRKTYPQLSRATVYRNVNVLAESGEIRLVCVPNSAVRADAYTTPHYHIKCRECGGVFDVAMSYAEHLERKVVQKNGFQFEGHELIFIGLCPSCREKCSLKERLANGEKETAEQGDRGTGH